MQLFSDCLFALFSNRKEKEPTAFASLLDEDTDAEEHSSSQSVNHQEDSLSFVNFLLRAPAIFPLTVLPLFRSHSEEEPKSEPPILSSPKSSSASAPAKAGGGVQRRRMKYEQLVHTKDRVFTNQKLNTGVMEDLRLWFLLRIDLVVNFLRGLFRRFFEFLKSLTFFGAVYFVVSSIVSLRPTAIIVGVVSFIFRVITGFAALCINLPVAVQRFFTPFPVDRRNTRDLVVGQGYPYERYDVITEDGYVLQLERLPQPKSTRVLYFQHGVVDNSFAWFGHIEGEAASALAFRAFDEGYDVFVGTLRGCGGSTGHTRPSISQEEYWDFTVNEHAFQDLPAFVSKIREVKNQDLQVSLNEPPQHQLTFIAHSVRCRR